MAGIYKLRSTPVAPFTTYFLDGAKLLWYNNEWHHISGWNPFNGAPTIKPWHYTSANNGASWTQLADMPQGGRTEAGALLKNSKLYLYSGNDSDTSTAEDVWSYDPVNGWVLVAETWAEVGRQWFGHAHCMHKGYAYAAGGQSRTDELYINKVYRSADMVNWSLVTASLPAAMQDLVYPTMVSFGGDLIFMGGGRIAGGQPFDINTKVFRSTNDGASWSEILDSPLFNSGLWGVSCVAGGDTILYVSGSDTDNEMDGLNNRIIFSHNGTTWYHLHAKVPGRHAASFASDGTDALLMLGFGQTDAWLLKRIS